MQRGEGIEGRWEYLKIINKLLGHLLSVQVQLDELITSSWARILHQTLDEGVRKREKKKKNRREKRRRKVKKRTKRVYHSRPLVTIHQIGEAHELISGDLEACLLFQFFGRHSHEHSYKRYKYKYFFSFFSFSFFFYLLLLFSSFTFTIQHASRNFRERSCASRDSGLYR